MPRGRKPGDPIARQAAVWSPGQDARRGVLQSDDGSVRPLAHIAQGTLQGSATGPYSMGRRRRPPVEGFVRIMQLDRQVGGGAPEPPWLATSVAACADYCRIAAPRNLRAGGEHCRQAGDRSATGISHASDRDGPIRGLDNFASPYRLEATAKLDELCTITNKINRDLEHSGLFRHCNNRAAHSVSLDDEPIGLGVGSWCFEYERPTDHAALAERSRV